eukprot:c37469_g1_i1 orf=17-184(-)
MASPPTSSIPYTGCVTDSPLPLDDCALRGYTIIYKFRSAALINLHLLCRVILISL